MRSPPPRHDVEYLWILHSDARPRPDALAALVSELDRNEASLGGSKLLVAGTRDELESVGSATDVFGEPFSGLDEGEIDLQQYDVVREVAFVSSVSMLVRRDLAQGLAGARRSPRAGSGRSRLLATGAARRRVGDHGSLFRGLSPGSVPSGGPRMAGAGRPAPGHAQGLPPHHPGLGDPVPALRRPGRLLFNLILLRWRPAARHAASWGWNLLHLPSTITARRRFKPVRAFGDEELFRFQARGSVRLRDRRGRAHRSPPVHVRRRQGPGPRNPANMVEPGDLGRGDRRGAGRSRRTVDLLHRCSQRRFQFRLRATVGRLDPVLRRLE